MASEHLQGTYIALPKQADNGRGVGLRSLFPSTRSKVESKSRVLLFTLLDRLERSCSHLHTIKTIHKILPVKTILHTRHFRKLESNSSNLLTARQANIPEYEVNHLWLIWKLNICLEIEYRIVAVLDDRRFCIEGSS